ncbi:uncharacterized protein LOC127864815 isoform X2 [Dreissena polymorpha]|uniref:uncharacterized protein LOC127864815 isoform X2 n=1 Tax=Dreissena polymorpha TaxID=45954 RepID=UPI0022647B9C|nr:uncharacterized protein LOC127864815 isoform X2 [Dreissena polymorpha]
MATSGKEAHQEFFSDCIVIKSCEPCTRKHTSSTATIFCKTCNEYLCEPCRNIHIIYKSGTHDTVAVEYLDSAPVVVTMKGMDTCRDHDKKIKFFCEDHSKLCCSTCAFIHRKCDKINELASISSQEGPELQDVKNTLLKMETDTGKIVAECKLSEAELSETNANLFKQIDRIKGCIIELFEKAKTQLTADADNFKADEIKKIEQSEAKRNKAWLKVNEDINELLSVSSALVKHGTPQQNYIVTKIIKEKIKDMETHISEKRCNQITPTISIDFSKQLLSILKEEEVLVKLKVERHLKHTDVAQTSPTEIQELSEVRKKTSVLNEGFSSDCTLSVPIKPVTLELLVSVDLKQYQYDGKEPLLTGLDFLPDGRLVSVDNMNWKCIIMDDRLKRQGTPYTFNTNPFDVVCLSHNELAVTMNDKTIRLLSVSPGSDIGMTRTIQTSTDVFSICCMTPTDMVVSTHNDTDQVRKITQSGVVSYFDHGLVPNKRYKIDESKCTYVISKNTLVFTDWLANSVYMNDCAKGTSKVVTDENIQQPRGACVGPGDTVLVCSGATSSIVHLTVDGIMLGTYPVDMRWPYSLCLNKEESRLAVSNNAAGMKRLMVYKLL